MTARAFHRGHPIYLDQESGIWRYSNDDTPASVDRPCIKCNRPSTPEGYDACLGRVPGATSACCGHGVEPGYAVMEDGECVDLPEPEAKHLITGEEALVVLEYPEELTDEVVDKIAAAMQSQGIKRYIILTSGITLETVDEDTMRRLGWVRAPKRVETKTKPLLRVFRMSTGDVLVADQSGASYLSPEDAAALKAQMLEIADTISHENYFVTHVPPHAPMANCSEEEFLQMGCIVLRDGRAPKEGQGHA